MKMPESYYCFYPTNPMWVGPCPDFARFRKGGISLAEFMGEQVIRDQSDGFSVVFCKDGMCMLRIDALENEMWAVRKKEGSGGVSEDEKRRLSERWLSLHRQYLHYLNAMQILLDSAVLQVNRYAFLHSAALRLGDVFPIVIDKTRLCPVVDYSGCAGFHATRNDLHKGRWPENYDQTVPIEEDERITRRREVPEEVFQQARDQFEKAFRHNHGIDILSQILVAVDNYNVANYSVALVQGWFLIELFLNMCWVDFLAEQQVSSPGDGPRINAERRKILTGRDFTASIISNVLELTGRIETDLFKKIDRLRKARNVVSHDLDRVAAVVSEKLKERGKPKESKTASADDCKTAFQVVEVFVQQEYDISLGLGQAVI